jgi:arylsulfatase A-like enzyme
MYQRSGAARGSVVIVGGVIGVIVVVVGLVPAMWHHFEPHRPNILVISLCSVRPDHMGCYGYHRNTTPSFNLLVRDSIVFENAITQWPKTAPAFAALMSGKYGHTTGVMRITPRQRLGDEHVTLAEVLRDHGYETAAFVSSPAISRHTNVFKGFDTFVETFFARERNAAYSEATQGAVDWLERSEDTPFLLWVHYNNAHYPYVGDPEHPDLFVDDAYYDRTRRVRVNPDEDLPLPVSDDHPFRRQIVRPDMGGVHPWAVLPERPFEYDYYIARYDAGIHAADRLAGELLEVAREKGLLENTIVVVVGDHGEALGEHNHYFEHGRFPYDECAKVPLIIRPAGGTQTERVDTPVATFGLAPTLLEMVGIEAPEAMESESFWSMPEDSESPSFVFTESGYQLDYTLSVRSEAWKLIHVPNPVDQILMTGREYELYDLVKDPGESSNLIEERPDQAARLGDRLEAWSNPWREQAYGSDEAVPDIENDEETIRRLRALGYIGDED